MRVESIVYDPLKYDNRITLEDKLKHIAAAHKITVDELITQAVAAGKDALDFEIRALNIKARLEAMKG